MQMQRDIMHRHRLQAELTLALHFHTVNPDVLLAEVFGVERIAGDNARFIEIKAPVTVVQAEQRQNVEQVDVFPVHRVLRPGRICTTLWRDGEFVPATNKLVDLFFHRGICWQSHRNSVVLPRADSVHHHTGIGEAANIIEPQRRRTIANASGSVGGGG